MKKNVVIVLILFTLMFFMGGVYIIYAIEKTSSTLDKLITLHQVEILREHLLTEIKRVQANLSLHNTRYAKGLDAMVSNVKNIERIINTCFDCHHSEEMTGRLVHMKGETEGYKMALSRVFTIRSNIHRLRKEEDKAFQVGEKLAHTVAEMIGFAKMRLDKKTQAAIHEIATTKTILYVLVGFGPLLSLVLTTMFVRGFTRPMGHLLEATRNLKEGNLDHRIQGLRYEFGELAGSFNDMAASLKDQMQKMQRTEQMVVCGEMTTRLAHEIKNPLAGIKLSMEVLSEESSIAREDRDVLKKVIDEVLRIEQMIRGLLNFARPADPQFMKINVVDVLEKTLALYQKYSPPRLEQTKRIEIVKEVGSHLPEIEADPFQIQQIFLNLFLNASDAMPDGGKLLLKIHHDILFQTLQIEVSDTGTGIQKELLVRLFQPFFTTKAKGTGLGLTITQQLVEQHHGLISVKNNPDGGATFKISFPLNGRRKENV